MSTKQVQFLASEDFLSALQLLAEQLPSVQRLNITPLVAPDPRLTAEPTKDSPKRRRAPYAAKSAVIQRWPAGTLVTLGKPPSAARGSSRRDIAAFSVIEPKLKEPTNRAVVTKWLMEANGCKANGASAIISQLLQRGYLYAHGTGL